MPEKGDYFRFETVLQINAYIFIRKTLFRKLNVQMTGRKVD